MDLPRILRRMPLVYTLCAIVCALLFIKERALPKKDEYGCRALLASGDWTPASLDGDRRLQGHHTWEPSGCRLGNYKAKDIKACVGSRKIIFLGDSTIRQIFWAAAVELDPDQARERMEAAEKHSNQEFEAHGITLLYIWDTWINSTALDAQLALFQQQWGPSDAELDDRAALLVVGTSAFWTAAFTGDEDLSIFMQGVDRIKGAVRQTLEQSIMGADTPSVDQILVSPVLYPNYNSLDGGREDTLTPQKLEYMNELLAASSPELSSRVLWSYNSLTDGLEGVHDEMGVHVSPSIARLQFQIALDARCNNLAAQNSPPKGTCCVTPPKMTTLQHILGPSLAFVFAARLITRGVSGWSQVELACGHIAVALVWSWLADRSGTFDGVERHFSSGASLLICIAWLTVSFWAGKSTVPSLWRGTWSAGYLAREQSDELKGIMQGLILIYHYTHSSRVLPVYKVVRLFIGLYFFLSTYGQSTLMLRGMRENTASKLALPDSYKVRHVLAVLFRLNLLCVLLPFTMITTNYFSYYFSPCISFWFMVTWTTLRIKPRWNLNPWAFTSKAAVALLASNLIISTPGVLEGASWATEWALGVYWSAKEMRFRLSLDRFVPFAGMLVASWNFQRRVKLEETRIPDASAGSSTTPAGPKAPVGETHEAGLNHDGLHLPLWVLIGSIGVIAVYMYYLILPTPFGQGMMFPKYDYNVIHPYASPFPLVALLALRNSTPALRRFYLRLPAGLGRISLETYVLQYHIWLGNDATSILSLGLADRYYDSLPGPFSPWLSAKPILKTLEACLLTAVFLALAHVTHQSTRILGQWVFGKLKSHSAPSQKSVIKESAISAK